MRRFFYPILLVVSVFNSTVNSSFAQDRLGVKLGVKRRTPELVGRNSTDVRKEIDSPVDADDQASTNADWALSMMKWGDLIIHGQAVGTAYWQDSYSFQQGDIDERELYVRSIEGLTNAGVSIVVPRAFSAVGEHLFSGDNKAIHLENFERDPSKRISRLTDRLTGNAVSSSGKIGSGLASPLRTISNTSLVRNSSSTALAVRTNTSVARTVAKAPTIRAAVPMSKGIGIRGGSDYASVIFYIVGEVLSAAFSQSGSSRAVAEYVISEENRPTSPEEASGNVSVNERIRELDLADSLGSNPDSTLPSTSLAPSISLRRRGNSSSPMPSELDPLLPSGI